MGSNPTLGTVRPWGFESLQAHQEKVVSVEREIIQQMHDEFSDPSNWTHGVIARDVDGGSVLHDDPRAVSWCLMGLINRICWDRRLSYTFRYERDATQLKGLQKAHYLLQRQATKAGYQTLKDANDVGGYSVVMSMLQGALDEITERESKGLM